MGKIKEKNYCDNCKKTTWHKYNGSEKKKNIKGRTKINTVPNISALVRVQF